MAVLVDGYNLLLSLAARERIAERELDLATSGRRLEELLADWAAVRGEDVTLVWDGARRRMTLSTPGNATLRVVPVHPPAEADDWIVQEAGRLTRQGLSVQVVTRDLGLVRRLPRGAGAADFDALIADLYAIDSDPIAAPHLGDNLAVEGLEQAMEGAVDTARLPRLRRKPAAPSADPSLSAVPARPTLSPSAVRSPPPPPPPAPRSVAAEKKSRARARYERAQARKKRR